MAGIANLAGVCVCGGNLQRQKGGILSVIIYHEPPPALLCNKKILLSLVDPPESYPHCQEDTEMKDFIEGYLLEHARI